MKSRIKLHALFIVNNFPFFGDAAGPQMFFRPHERDVFPHDNARYRI